MSNGEHIGILKTDGYPADESKAAYERFRAARSFFDGVFATTLAEHNREPYFRYGEGDEIMVYTHPPLSDATLAIEIGRTISERLETGRSEFSPPLEASEIDSFIPRTEEPS